ncbi:hypothetical protein N7447_001645 [Penicillium robsamsonii]|uniref:uncharacterized protein n=1 Tax=Penicillium robsamsonii TaxID=1792511 RepID=UPI002548506D|nr:uncharacterized protein N7447_001645 [Penicillium robsamsonii]KAJ5835619.1 hypothetical protein N7447_001645 [Penicillium robsamsonii]
MCPPCHPIGHDEQKGPWGISNVTLLTSLLALIHAVSVTLTKLLRMAIRGGINCYWEVLDKQPLEERVRRLENDLRSLKLGMTEEMHNLKSDRQGDRSRIKRLEDSHSDLKEDKKVLYKRVITSNVHLEYLDQGTLIE